MTEANQRNNGIDLLRIISMLMIVMLHVLGGSGYLNSQNPINSNIAWLIQAMVVCGVNCFGLISGYVGFNEKHSKYKEGKYLWLWVEVVFYLLSINIISLFVFPGAIEKIDIVKSFLPVSFSIYWYFTAYTGVYMLKPWINEYFEKASINKLNRLALIVFVIFSAYGGTISVLVDSFSLGFGYSFLWLFVLYILGAWIKKTDFLKDIKTYKLILIIISCIIASWLSKIYLPSRPDTAFGGVFADEILMSYVSPVTLIEAIAYICIFKRIKLHKQTKIISGISSATFGIYLIHTHPVIYSNIFLRFNSIFKDENIVLSLYKLIALTVAIFVICLAVEKIRTYSFRAFKIHILTENCEKLIIRGIKKITK